MCNLRYKKLKKIPLAFHNASKYNYHFIIKELPENLKDNLNAVEKIQKKKKSFSVSINKNLEYDKTLAFKSLLIALDAHYQVLLIIFQKEFRTINAKIVSIVLNT